MADTLQFDLVSPERRLAQMPATSVQLPASEGQMTAMPDHAPVITNLRPGLVTVSAADGGTSSYAVTGGFVEITETAATVLAERAYPATADNRESVEAHLAEAREKAKQAPAEHRDAAELFVDDLVQLMDDMV